MTHKNAIYIMLAVVLMCATAAFAQQPKVGGVAPFVENAGQWESQVRYAAQTAAGALFAEDDGITFVVAETVLHPAPYTDHGRHAHAYKVAFVGGQSSPTGIGMQQGYSNYIVGDPIRWRSHVGSYAAIVYSNVYPGVDIEVYAAAGGAKYNVVVHAGADVAQVALLYEGTQGVHRQRDGGLRIATTVGDVVEQRPYAYQPQLGGRSVECRWQVQSTKTGYVVRPVVGDYDHSTDLVIDPTLIFSTYTGSTADNWGTTAAYDSHKNTYTAGLVFDIGYPVSVGAYDISYGGGVDIGIFKFDTSGSQRLWATYLGGSSADMPHSMYVNMLDELLIFGTTGSTDFPTTAGAYSTHHSGGSVIDYESATIRFAAGSDIFVSRLSEDGTTLQASTFVGGSGNDGLNYRQRYNNSNYTIMQGNDSLYYNYGDGARGELVTDNLGNVYVGSTTMSADFPTTTHAVQATSGGRQEGVVFKLDYNLRTLLWSTYLGGSYDDAVYSVDVDNSYNVLVSGGSSSTNFPTTSGALQATYAGGPADGFVAKLSADGRRLIASTYFGARFYDQIYFVRCGKTDDVFLFGQTAATGNTMIHNAAYSVYGSGMLLARLSPNLDQMHWSTVFGTLGRINLSPTAFAADICNRVYAAGWGRDFVGHNGITWHTQGTTGMQTTADAYQSTTDGQDFYIISLDADAASLQYATFFGEQHQSGAYTGTGSDHVDGGTSRFDRLGTLYQSVCASCSRSQNFPISAGAWCDSNRSGNCNNAIFRFSVADDFPVAEFLTPQAGCAPYTVQLQNIGRGNTFSWDFGDGTTSTQASPQHTYTTPGTYHIVLVASMGGGCSETDTMRYTLQVLGGAAYTHEPEISCGSAGIQIGFAPSVGVTYTWSGDPVSDPTVANPWVVNGGTYILSTTATGCTQTDTFVVRHYDIVRTCEQHNPSCHNVADGYALLHMGQDIDADSVTVQVEPLRPWSVVDDSTLRIDSLQGGVDYTVQLDAYGCTFLQTLRTTNPPLPTYQKVATTTLCTDSCAGSIHITYPVGEATTNSTADTLIEGLCPGTYVVQLTSRGCPFADTTVVVRNNIVDHVTATADADEVFLGEGVQLHASVQNIAQVVVEYEWSPAAEVDRPYSPDPIATPTADSLACYTVQATSGGCSNTASVCVRCIGVVCGAPLFTIPNAFTPNADGVNDAVCFNTEELLEFSIAIFNRWGECVYSSTDPTQCWDGTYRGQPCLQGVYTYTCHIRCHSNHQADFKGDITLLR